MNFNELTQITSRQNNKARTWLKLNSAQGVKKYDRIIIEGVRACLTALENQAEIETILLTDDDSGKLIFERLMHNLTHQETKSEFFDKSFRVEKELFGHIASVKNPQGILFIIHKPQLLNFTLWLEEVRQNTVAENQKPLRLLFLDRITDPGNLGTIIRTAHAFAFDAILLMRGSVDPFNPKLMRSTMGSLFALKLLTVESYRELMATCQQHRLAVMITDMSGQDISEFWPDQKGSGSVICIGNEAHGISEELMKQADHVLRIPMPGHSESLNAAIAFGIVAYELNRKTGKK